MTISSHWIPVTYLRWASPPGRRQQVTQLVNLVPEPSPWLKASKRYRLCNALLADTQINRTLNTPPRKIPVPGNGGYILYGRASMHRYFTTQYYYFFNTCFRVLFSSWVVSSPCTRISPNGSVTHDFLFSSLLDVDCHMSILLPIARTDLKVATACLRDSSATCGAVFATHIPLRYPRRTTDLSKKYLNLLAPDPIIPTSAVDHYPEIRTGIAIPKYN